MRLNTRAIAVALSALMLLLVVGPGLALADSDDASGNLSLDVDQEETVTVAVSDDDGGVENASLTVSVDDGNATYDGAGNYTTDANGTVELPTPEETVNVTMTTVDDDRNVSESVTLEAAEEPGLELSVEQADDGTATVTLVDNDTAVENASVEVVVDDENTTYDGAGNYTTDANGTVGLPAPNATVNVTVTADHDGETVNVSATLLSADELDAEPDGPFGQQVKQFVHAILDGEGDENKTVGQQVSEFVTENNPGNAPDYAGPPDHAGPGNDAERGPPEHAGGSDNQTERGPPEHAGGSDNQTERGPPEHAGGSDNQTERGPPERAGDSDNQTERGPPAHAGPD